MPSLYKPGPGAAMVLAAALSAVGLSPQPARADALDASMPRVVVVGAPRGPAPSDRLDPYRTGRARTRLPASPVEIWRRHVAGSVDVSPIVDPAGNIIVALTIPEIVKLAPDAREIWRARLGRMAALTPPTLLSDGTIAVVTAEGIAWGFTPGGAVRFATPLGIPRRDADTAPLALSTGGLVVAAGSAIVEIDADGVIVARATLDEHGSERASGAVLEAPGRDGGALVTTATGNVYRFRPPAPPQRIGSFGGTTQRGAVVADARTLLAVVDAHRLVALDLPTGVTHVRAGGIALDGPPTLAPALDAVTPFATHPGGAPKSPAPLSKASAPKPAPKAADDGGSAPKPPPRAVDDGGSAPKPPLRAVDDGGSAPKPPLRAAAVTLVATQLGMLLGIDAAGNERAHLLLDKPLPSATSGFMLIGPFTQPDAKPSPPLVVDGSGRVAFVRASGRAGVVSPEGRVEIASERVCSVPIAVLPAGDKRMLVACHDGGLWMYGE